MLRAHRVVVAVTQLVLAGPGDLDGLAHFACQQRRFDHKIRFGFTAERTTEPRDMNRHVILVHATGLSHRTAPPADPGHPQHATVPPSHRAVAAGGSMGDWAKCGT